MQNMHAFHMRCVLGSPHITFIRQIALHLHPGLNTVTGQAMEMLWDDICRGAPDFSSPYWHANVLKEREQRLRDGEDKFADWDQAKKDIRDSIS